MNDIVLWKVVSEIFGVPDVYYFETKTDAKSFIKSQYSRQIDGLEPIRVAVCNKKTLLMEISQASGAAVEVALAAKAHYENKNRT